MKDSSIAVSVFYPCILLPLPLLSCALSSHDPCHLDLDARMNLLPSVSMDITLEWLRLGEYLSTLISPLVYMYTVTRTHAATELLDIF